MTREVLILRHANAVPHEARSADFDRELSAHGRDETRQVGEWLKSKDVKLDRVVSSPAARAKETAERALAIAGGPAIEFEPDIYEATPGTLIAVLERYAVPGRTMLVGHNPGLEQLVALLLEGRSGDVRGLPTSGLAWIALPESGEIEPGCGELKTFWWP